MKMLFDKNKIVAPESFRGHQKIRQPNYNDSKYNLRTYFELFKSN